MAAYTKLNLQQDVEDMAPRYGLSPGAESRFARVPLELCVPPYSELAVALRERALPPETAKNRLSRRRMVGRLKGDKQRGTPREMRA